MGLAAKLSIGACTVEKALSADVWPYRVHVRYFRTFKPKKDDKTKENAPKKQRTERTSAAGFSGAPTSNGFSSLENNVPAQWILH